jgi:hypothetical protein
MCSEELKGASPEIVAQIASRFVCNGESLVRSVIMAYELLDIVFSAKQTLRRSGSYRDGVVGYEMHQNSLKKVNEAFSKMQSNSLTRDELGRLQPVDFEIAMTKLFPRLPKEKRMPRFRDWLKFAFEQDFLVAGDLIAKFQAYGIPPHIYNRCSFDRDYWWSCLKSEINSKSGALGQAAKKPKSANTKVKSKRRKSSPKK